MTGIANAHVSRAPVLVLSGTPPAAAGKPRRPCRTWTHTHARSARSRAMRAPCASRHLCCRNSTRRSRGPLARAASPARPISIFPTDTLRAIVPARCSLRSTYGRSRAAATRPDPQRVAEAVDLLWSARRVLVISGRGARGAGPELVALLDRLGAVYLDTGESRGPGAGRAPLRRRGDARRRDAATPTS